MPDDPEDTPREGTRIPEERPTQPQLTRVCPVCGGSGMGTPVTSPAPGKFHVPRCAECLGTKFVTVERYQELTQRTP
jgi:hypothetical protein